LMTPVLGADGTAIAALTVPYITLINTPVAPDISTTIQLLGDTTRNLSEMAGAGFKADE
jgi:DNA-binding IclR family transcriptional regulator